MPRTITRLALIAVLAISQAVPLTSIAAAQNRSIAAPHSSQQDGRTAGTTPRASIRGETGFHRQSQVAPGLVAERHARGSEIGGRISAQSLSQRWLARVQPSQPSITTQSLGTGGGDIFETEPNDPVAQAVSLPVNVFGQISFNGDVDFFAFPTFAGQQVTVEAFAARVSGSVLIPDIALFDQGGNLLVEDVGDETTDPLIRYTSPTDQVLIAGIADLFDEGGSRFNYILNIVRGIDVDEVEPDDTVAQILPALPVTVFGSIDFKPDVDSYVFNGAAGETLIADVDAESIGSKLDSEITIKDAATGTQLFSNDQYDGDDSRLNIVLPATGQYILTVNSFQQNTRGFYRLNLSLVPGDGAPTITGVTKVSKKFITVTGTGLTQGSTVEVNGAVRPTTIVDANTLQARIKIRPGDIVTVSNLPEDRRSNPFAFQ